MLTLPMLNITTNENQSPHVVILGAGASRAAFPDGDIFGNTVPVMADIINCLELNTLIRDYGYDQEIGNFEEFYNDLITSGKHSELVIEIENRVIEYFFDLHMPENATIYDYLVLSLREKDVIATFNWDPFLALAWKRNSHVARLPKMIYLHGNVAIACCRNCRIKGFIGEICAKCKEKFIPVPLLYPVKKKNYNDDPFIKAEWIEFKYYLEYAYFLTIFGYSAPKADIEARKLLLEAWKNNTTFDLAQINIIDIRDENELEDAWKEFLCRQHYAIFESIWNSYIFRYPRRSCEALAMATLQLSPWDINPFPKTRDLAKLQEWAKKLIVEENEGKLTGSVKIFE